MAAGELVCLEIISGNLQKKNSFREEDSWDRSQTEIGVGLRWESAEAQKHADCRLQNLHLLHLLVDICADHKGISLLQDCSHTGTLTLHHGAWNGPNVALTTEVESQTLLWMKSTDPSSEFYGRRPVYLVSFSMFFIWIIPSAVAQNIQTMLIARFFDGLSGSAFLSVAGGTVGDMFNREQLQLPMLIYTASPFVGPSIGPLFGGFINQYSTWRWTFYMLLIWSGANLGLIALLVPETYHPVLLRNKAQKMRKETGDERWKAPMEKMDKSIPKTIAHSLKRPFQLLVLEPMVTNLCLFSAILLGILYLFFGAFPVVFEGNHDFTLSQVGLSFLGLFVGMCMGALTDPFWHKNYVRLIKQREAATGEVGASEPEYRLPPAIAGAVLVPVGIFLFAWTTYASVHWIVPIIGSSIFGMG